MPLSKEEQTAHERLPLGLTAKGHQRIYVEHQQYVDRSQGIDCPMTTKEKEVIAYYQKGQEITGPFPLKLHGLLRIVEKLHMDHIFGWQPHGRSFTIRDPSEFESLLMKRFFNQGQISSFRRQLNLYNFQRITRGPDAGSYYHGMFLRGKPLLAVKMTRMKVKGTKFRATSSPEDEPDFYGMPYLAPYQFAARPSQSSYASGAKPIGVASPCNRQEQELQSHYGGIDRPSSTSVRASGPGPLWSTRSLAYTQEDAIDLLAFQYEMNIKRLAGLYPSAPLPPALPYAAAPLPSFVSEDTLRHLRHDISRFPTLSDAYNAHVCACNRGHMADQQSTTHLVWEGGAHFGH